MAKCLYGNIHLVTLIGDNNFATFCVISAFADENGRCTVSQDTIAHLLGIGTQAAQQRIKNLLDCIVNGHPIITVERKPFQSSTYQIDTSWAWVGDE